MPTSPRQRRPFASDFVFPEGPRWHAGELWLSDQHAHRVYAIAPDGTKRTVVELDDRPSGLGFTPDGALLAVTMLDRKLLRVDPGGKVREVADLTPHCDGFLNDMVVDAQGRAYVGGRNRAGGSLGPLGAVILVTPDGQTRTVARDLEGPNGSVITPDGRTLIVAETHGHRLAAFDIEADGSLANRWVYAETGTRMPDGICLDTEGAIWIGSPQEHEFVRVHEGGRESEVIPTGDLWAIACALGGEDRRTLYLLVTRTTLENLARLHRERGLDATSESEAWVEAVRVDVPGAGWP
jgi:sugar lactone lactonase YvrE